MLRPRLPRLALLVALAAAPAAAQGGSGDVPPAEPPAVPEAPPAEARAKEPAVPEGAPAPEEGGAEEPPVAWSPGYRDLSGARALLEAWADARPGFARFGVLATTAGGRDVPLLELGALEGPPLEERPTVLLVGGLDGVSISGAEAVLAIVAALLSEPERLPASVAFVAIPWGAPDGLASWVDGRGGDGRNARPTDDDRDGRTDEDGPDDLDGDGRVLDMLIEDPEGRWTRREDPRFLRPAEPGDAPRYRLLREGRDDDGDGLYNEDPEGGVVLDHQFPVGWRGVWDGVAAGPWPLSEPVARALAHLALARRTMAVLVLQGSHGRIATPGGTLLEGPEPARLPYPEDAALFEEWTRRFAAHTSRAQPEPLALAEARGEAWTGAAIDWCYASAAALAFEIAPWGPELQRDEAVDAAWDPRADGADGPRTEDQRWAAWLDDELGGLGFVDWSPVTLSEGRRALVGGWAPRTRVNPPAETLPAVLGGLGEFARELGEARPRLEIEVQDAHREEGGLCRLRARLRNAGSLPTGLSRPGTFGRPGGWLRLELPSGARLVAGAAERSLPHVPGGGETSEMEWFLLVPEGGSVTLVAGDDWTLPARAEVRF